MKKVGILTLYYKTFNYGAQLQAYALQKAISRLGYEAEQISFRWYGVQTEVNYQNSSINKEDFEVFSNNISHSKYVYTPHDIRDAAKHYDIFVCGSDQIWGVNYSMPIYVLPQITLAFVPDDKIKIAYAASMGGSLLSPKARQALLGPIKRLDALSVREKSGQAYVTEMRGTDVEVVLDPVMLLHKDDWIEIAVFPYREKNYILVYDIGLKPEIMQVAEELADRYGCDIVRISYINGIEAGPEKFIGLIHDAKYVITDSFHGTVLSIIFHKQFVTFGVDNIKSGYSKNIRILDLLQTFHLTDRFVEDSCSDVNQIINSEIDYTKIEYLLEAMRCESLSFLKDSLEIPKEKNIEKTLKSRCSGCSACSLVCPQGSISMIKDELGFLYPHIDEDICTNCQLCIRACPALNPLEKTQEIEIKAYAIKNKDKDIRFNSSSGGAFHALANKIIKEGGIVFGAKYSDDFLVCHGYCDNEKDLNAFMRSKYVQSDIKDCFSEVRKFLDANRKVLFSGTPCQISGLKSYLGKIYENLLTIDLVCGGVTSPLLWNKYLEYQSKSGNLKNISMRYKEKGYLTSEGFPSYSMKLEFDNQDENIQVISNEEDLFLSTRFAFYRENCYQCDFKGIRHDSDITIGDFCGINHIDRQADDGWGVSLVLIQSEKGRALLEDCQSIIDIEEHPINTILPSNPMIMANMKKPLGYEYLRAICKSSSIEKLYYETKLLGEMVTNENIQRSFHTELIRNDLIIKLLKYQFYGLSVEDDPEIKGDVIVYGAGKLGRQLLPCIRKKLICFIDKSERIESCEGLPVYRLDSRELKEIIKSKKVITIIVTPVWEFYNIKEYILDCYPDVNVVSLEKVVEKI